MDNLIIKSTKSSPLIDFNGLANVLTIEGRAYPENAALFYEPVLQWLTDYLEMLEPRKSCIVNMRLSYINTSSVKAIMMILDLLNEHFERGKNIIINWYYDEENDVALEAGEEFKEDLSLPFNILISNRPNSSVAAKTARSTRSV